MGLGQEEKALDEPPILQQIANEIHQVASKVEGQTRRLHGFYSKFFGTEPIEVDENKDTKVEPNAMVDKLQTALSHAHISVESLMAQIDRLEKRNVV